MTGDAVLDRRSLTLPDWRAALKRRVRRPKLPDKRRLMLLTIQVVGVLSEGGIFFLWSPFVPCLLIAVGFALDAAVNVRAMRRGLPVTAPNPRDLPLVVTALALFAVGTAWALAVLVVS